MKKLFYQLIISSLLVIWSCGQAGEGAQTQSSSLPDNTPKGQASVVDDVSAKNILMEGGKNLDLFRILLL